MGELVLPYFVASDTKTGKPSPSYTVREQKDGPSCVSRKLFSFSGSQRQRSKPHAALFQVDKTTGDLDISSQRSSKEQLS